MYLSHLQGSAKIQKREVENDLEVPRDTDGSVLLPSVRPVNVNIVEGLQRSYKAHGAKPLPTEHEAVWDPAETRERDQYDHGRPPVRVRPVEPLYRNDEQLSGINEHISKYPATGGYHSVAPHPKVVVPSTENAEMGVPVQGVQGAARPSQPAKVEAKADTTALFHERMEVRQRLGGPRHVAQMSEQANEREMRGARPVAVEERGDRVDAEVMVRREEPLRLKDAPAPVEAGAPIRGEGRLRSDAAPSVEPAAVRAHGRGAVRPESAPDTHTLLSHSQHHIMQAALRMPRSGPGEYTLADMGLEVERRGGTTAMGKGMVRDVAVRAADDDTHGTVSSISRVQGVTSTARGRTSATLVSDASHRAQSMVQAPHREHAARSKAALKDDSAAPLVSEGLSLPTRPAKASAVRATRQTPAAQIHKLVQFMTNGLAQRNEVRASRQEHEAAPASNVRGSSAHATERPHVSASSKTSVRGAVQGPVRGLGTYLHSIIGGTVRAPSTSSEMPALQEVVERGEAGRAVGTQESSASMSTRPTNGMPVQAAAHEQIEQSITLTDKSRPARMPGGVREGNRPIGEW